MISLINFAPEHWHQIAEQGATSHLRHLVTDAHLAALAAQPHSYTAMCGDTPIACGGLVEHWPGRGELWGVLAGGWTKEFRAVHNATRRFLEVVRPRRTEWAVAVDFPAAHRWARLLGFQLEVPRLRAYGPDGRDYALYVRVL